MLAKVLQALINFLGSVIAGLVGMLPSSPFQFSSPNWPAWIQAVGWIFPFDAMLTHFSVFLTAVLTWYGVRWALRLIRAVS